jgi:hypothetical protein
MSGVLPPPLIAPGIFEDVIFIPVKLFEWRPRGLTSVALCFARIANGFDRLFSFTFDLAKNALRQAISGEQAFIHSCIL